MPTKYERIIAHIFEQHYSDESTGFEFTRSEINDATEHLNLSRISNVGDVIYTFRSRKPLPQSIRSKAPGDQEWIIRTTATGRYRFDLIPHAVFRVNQQLSETLIPDSTPALIHLYKQSDEQALLAIIRYNRLIDVFTRLSCFSVQSHLRTSLQRSGQIEVDELYVGLDRSGAHYAIPVEVKSAKDVIGYVQIDNMFELCAQRFPHLTPRPLGAQFIDDAAISIASERHYRLVPHEELPDDLVARYGQRLNDRPV